MYANDRLGDCTCAAAGHMIEAWTAASQGHAVKITEATVVNVFEHVKVVDPVTYEEGAVELDVLNYWRKTGFGTHKIGAYASVPIHDHKLVRTAAYLFGACTSGSPCRSRPRTQEVWDWTHSLSGNAAPGSWGGHAVDVVDYGPDELAVVTWGTVKRMTWAFWDRYVDEAYCILSPDFLKAGEAPNGFDLASLQAGSSTRHRVVSQRAALYTVRVRPRSKRDGALPLGDLDGSGTGLLGGSGATCSRASSSRARTRSRTVRVLATTIDGDDLLREPPARRERGGGRDRRSGRQGAAAAERAGRSARPLRVRLPAARGGHGRLAGRACEQRAWAEGPLRGRGH